MSYKKKIPYQLTEDQLNMYVLEHLQLGKRGYAIKIPILAIINAILFKIRVGCPWYMLEGMLFNGHIVKYETVYYHFNRWSKLGCFEKIFENFLTLPNDIEYILLDSTYIESSLDCSETEFSGYKKKLN